MTDDAALLCTFLLCHEGPQLPDLPPPPPTPSSLPSNQNRTILDFVDWFSEAKGQGEGEPPPSCRRAPTLAEGSSA